MLTNKWWDEKLQVHTQVIKGQPGLQARLRRSYTVNNKKQKFHALWKHVKDKIFCKVILRFVWNSLELEGKHVIIDLLSKNKLYFAYIEPKFTNELF